MTEADFKPMSRDQLFGWFLYLRLDSENYAEPEDYTKLFTEFKSKTDDQLIEELAARGFYK